MNFFIGFSEFSEKSTHYNEFWVTLLDLGKEAQWLKRNRPFLQGEMLYLVCTKIIRCQQCQSECESRPGVVGFYAPKNMERVIRRKSTGEIPVQTLILVRVSGG